MTDDELNEPNWTPTINPKPSDAGTTFRDELQLLENVDAELGHAKLCARPQTLAASVQYSPYLHIALGGSHAVEYFMYIGCLPVLFSMNLGRYCRSLATTRLSSTTARRQVRASLLQPQPRKHSLETLCSSASNALEALI
jgi:hypothetical protein